MMLPGEVLRGSFMCSKCQPSGYLPPRRWRSGPLRLERGGVSNPLFKAFFTAVQEAGHELTTDVNGYKQEGFSAFLEKRSPKWRQLGSG